MAGCAISWEVGDWGGVGRTLSGEGEWYFRVIGGIGGTGVSRSGQAGASKRGR